MNNGQTVIITFADGSPTCDNEDSIDLSVSAFQAISPLSAGKIPSQSIHHPFLFVCLIISSKSAPQLVSSHQLVACATCRAILPDSYPIIYDAVSITLASSTMLDVSRPTSLLWVVHGIVGVSRCIIVWDSRVVVD
ncbi:hypothetical protein J3R83DRAFT_3971 [Lanmaoa asiatica]|nr:hypothetical protein J3R83DRAFT_3971 [Lanmaoa asiatica]